MAKKNISQFDHKPPRQNKPRVLVDLDGVVRDFVSSLIKVYKRKHPEHEVLTVNSRKLEDFFPIGPGVYQFMEPGYIEEIIEEAQPYKGAISVI